MEVSYSEQNCSKTSPKSRFMVVTNSNLYKFYLLLIEADAVFQSING